MPLFMDLTWSTEKENQSSPVPLKRRKHTVTEKWGALFKFWEVRQNWMDRNLQKIESLRRDLRSAYGEQHTVAQFLYLTTPLHTSSHSAKSSLFLWRLQKLFLWTLTAALLINTHLSKSEFILNPNIRYELDMRLTAKTRNYVRQCKRIKRVRMWW